MSALEAKDRGAALARDLAGLPGEMAILAEGNTSVRVSEESFVVKASGLSMRDLDTTGMSEVRFAPIRSALEGPDLEDHRVREVLRSATCEGDRLPSVETFLHAVLLDQPGVEVVGHTHPPLLLSLLCRADAEDLASQRLFPDEIVCCGPRACYVPYADPGVPLARAVREAVEAYRFAEGEPPRTIWMQNHGLIALGSSDRQVVAATWMQEKAARVWQGALASGGEVRTLDENQVQRIWHRPDEHHRQRLLFGGGTSA